MKTVTTQKTSEDPYYRTTTTGTSIMNQKWYGDDEYFDESLEIACRGVPGRVKTSALRSF